MPEKMAKHQQPCQGALAPRRGCVVLWAVGVALLLGSFPTSAAAGDGASEALELRLHAERAIAEERAAKHGPLADMMQGMMHGMLLEYLASRDETIALDVVDEAFVRERVKVAELMEDPGLAWALDVFAGPETGYELGLRTSLANLADFHKERAQRATEAALRTYEREVTRHLDRVDKAHDLEQELDSRKIEAGLVKAADRIERVEAKAEKTAEKAAEKIEKAVEKAEKAVEKAEEKAEKAAEKAEEKAEKEGEKSEEKAEKEAEKAEDTADKDAEKSEGGEKDKEKDKDDKKGGK